MNRLIILSAAVVLCGCDEFFEKNLEDKSIEVVAPVDMASLPEGNATLSWRELEGAKSYRVTVVSPSLASAARIVADTIIRTDSIARPMKLNLKVEQGSYQWRIFGINGGYRSKETVSSFNVFKLPQEEQ